MPFPRPNPVPPLTAAMRICATCAFVAGAVAKEDIVRVRVGTCERCGQYENVVAVPDWDWSGAKQKPTEAS